VSIKRILFLSLKSEQQEQAETLKENK